MDPLDPRGPNVREGGVRTPQPPPVDAPVLQTSVKIAAQKGWCSVAK